MQRDDLATGNQLVTLIDYYTSVMTDLADPTKKEETLYAILSSGNSLIPAGDEAAFITGLRNDIIAGLITNLNTRIDDKQATFDELGESL